MSLDEAIQQMSDTIKAACADAEIKTVKMSEEEARYGAEKKEIEMEAKKLEHERDVYRRKDPYFDYGEVLLQIAIVMASVAILSGSRPVFYFAIVSAFLGALSSINGFFLIFRIPFLH